MNSRFATGRSEWSKDEIEAIRHQARSEFLRSGHSELPTRVVAAFETPEQERDQVEVSIVAEFSENVAKMLEAALPSGTRRRIMNLEERICELYSETPTLDQAYILHEPRGEPPASFLLIRGSASNPGPELEPATPAILSFKADFPEWACWQSNQPSPDGTREVDCEREESSHCPGHRQSRVAISLR